jgi:hypothetical protein
MEMRRGGAFLCIWYKPIFLFLLSEILVLLRVKDDLEVSVLWPGLMLDIFAMSSFGSAFCFSEAGGARFVVTKHSSWRSMTFF